MRRCFDSLAWVAVVVVVGGVIAWGSRPEPAEAEVRPTPAAHWPRHASCCEGCTAFRMEASVDPEWVDDRARVGVGVGVGVAETIEVSDAREP